MDDLNIPQGQPVVVIQTTDENGGTFGLQLTDYALPDRGLSVPIEHRIVKSTPAGAYEPIVQRVGFVLQSFTVTGSFDDANLAATGRADEWSGILYLMTAGGRLCQMAYSDKWTMEGYIRRYSPTYQESGRITWSFEFEPTKCSLVDKRTYTVQQQYVRDAADARADAVRAIVVADAIRISRDALARTNIIRSFALGAT